MDATDHIPETEEEAARRAEELKQKAKESKQEQDSKQNQLLNAVAQGDEAIHTEKTETVQVGQVTVEVKTYFPGSTLRALRSADDNASLDERLTELISAMADLTEALQVGDTIETDDDAILEWWTGIADRYGPQAFVKATERVMGPAKDNLEDMDQVMHGFRSDGQSQATRSSVRNDGNAPKRDSQPTALGETTRNRNGGS